MEQYPDHDGPQFRGLPSGTAMAPPHPPGDFMGGHYPMTELRRNASVPSLGLPRQMPRSMSMCLPPGKRAFAAETEGVQSWDEYQSIRDAQAARRPAARRCLENTLEIAARARSFPLTRGYSRRGSLDALNLPPCARRLEPAFAPVRPEERDLKLVPLQHLLLSPAAAALSTLDVKAIICKVALDLDALHAQRSLHRHVSVACIAVPATGHLPASRLLPHGANIRCEGGGGTATCPVAFQGMEPYLAPELAMVAAGDDARSPAMHTPACDMWSLGVVLFVMLSGSHVPFGNRGLGQTSIPNMPGRGESVDALQSWLQEHLECKMGVVNAMARAGSDTAACRDMRVLGFDPGAVDVVLGLLRADPAQRLSAHAVARHGWLAEVAAEVGAAACAGRRPDAPRPGARSRRASPDLAQGASAPEAAGPSWLGARRAPVDIACAAGSGSSPAAAASWHSGSAPPAYSLQDAWPPGAGPRPAPAWPKSEALPVGAPTLPTSLSPHTPDTVLGPGPLQSATWRRPEAGAVPDAQGLPPTPPIPPAQPPPAALGAMHASPTPLPPIAPGTLGWLARPTCTGPCPALATLHPVVLLGAGPQVGTQPVGLTRLPPDPGSCTLLADGSWWIPVPVAAACQRLPTSA
ncbi:hypothetical protein ACKKBG_A13995 [Auxenochlorella protothecoides x Auxenochlorella symbiontica]